MIKEGIKVHSVVTDPPYHLVSIVSRFGKEGSAPTKDEGVFRRSSTGFMGKQWDGGDIAFKREVWERCRDLLLPGGYILAFAATRNYHRMACAIEDAGFEIRDQIGWLYGTGFPKSHKVGEGLGTALKPAWEPICVARKPIESKTVAQNVIDYGTGGLAIDDCRVEGGRWPANIIHDGSQEVLDAFPSNKSGVAVERNKIGEKDRNQIYGKYKAIDTGDIGYNDSGSCARFFYSAKTSKSEKGDTTHPTVKPVALMRYLVKLVTPIDGIVLDPFCGTGSTLEGAFLEGRNSIGIEREDEYVKDIQERMAKYTERLF